MTFRLDDGCEFFSGGHTREETPDPISNSEAKLSRADGTAGPARGRVGCRREVFDTPHFGGAFLYSVGNGVLGSRGPRTEVCIGFPEMPICSEHPRPIQPSLRGRALRAGMGWFLRPLWPIERSPVNVQPSPSPANKNDRERWARNGSRDAAVSGTMAAR